MNIVTIAWKSVRQRGLASALTILSVALGVALMVTVFVLLGIVTTLFNQSSSGYDLVVGKKGSPLQLVLNTVFYMDRPNEPLPYKYYRQLKAHRAITHAIPLTLGDTTEDGRFRTVGTIPEFFEVDYIPQKHFKFREGQAIAEPFDAVIGSRVARTYGWKVGHEFPIAHGGNVSDIHSQRFRVVGVLEPTGTPNDRVVFLHIDGFYGMVEHVKPMEEVIERDILNKQDAEMLSPGSPVTPPKKPEIKPEDKRAVANDPDAQKEVTAILVRTVQPTLAFLLKSKINEGNLAQAANPVEEISKLLRNLVGNIRTVLVVMAGMIIVVSVIGILVSIYNSMAERRREIAVMRALGARRITVLSIIVTEAIVLCGLGGLLGFLMGHGLVFIAGPYLEARSDILIDPWAFEWQELYIMPVLVLLATIAGLVPGWTAYQTDVAKGLQS